MDKIEADAGPLVKNKQYGCSSDSDASSIALTASTTSSECRSAESLQDAMADCCGASPKAKIDWLLWGSVAAVATGYFAYLLLPDSILIGGLHQYSTGVFELLNTMSWGLLLGILFVGLLGKVPRELVMGVLGTGGVAAGIFRATLAGLLLDLCSHGILLVGLNPFSKNLNQVRRSISKDYGIHFDACVRFRPPFCFAMM